MFFETNRDKIAFYNRGDNSCVLHFHRSVELLYVLSGEKIAYLNGTEYRLKEGDLLVCPPYALHAYPQAEYSEQIAATVPTEHCRQFETLCQSMQARSAVLHDGEREFLPLLTMLGTPSNGILFEGIANTVLGLFVQKSQLIPVEKSSDLTLAEAIASFVHTNYASPLTLESLANEFGYSRNYFSALFHTIFRTGISQYVNYVRIQKSLKLLKDHPVSAIYDQVGFCSPQQYYLNFKRIHGCSPKEYLAKMQPLKQEAYHLPQ